MNIQATILMLAIAAGAAHAQKTLKVLTPADIDPARLLPAPPPDGSEEQRREWADVQRLVRTRSAERLAQAKWDNEHEDATAFSGTLGPAFDLQKLPETAKLLNLVLNDQAVAASAANQFFQRRSPVAAVPAEVEAYSEWTCDKASKKPGDRPGGRSYPSGHTTLGYSVGTVLAALIPDKAQAILARAVDYGYSREVCGDHYHSDVDASRAYGTALGIAFLNNATLQPMILAARSELQAAR